MCTGNFSTSFTQFQEWIYRITQVSNLHGNEECSTIVEREYGKRGVPCVKSANTQFNGASGGEGDGRWMLLLLVG